MNLQDNENLSSENILKSLNSNRDGLSAAEADERLKKYGYNEIETKKQNPVVKFALKFTGTLAYLLYLVTAISIYLGKLIDAYVVIGLIIFNGVASFIEEYKADNTLELLKRKLSVMVNVKRDKVWISLPAKVIVPGDIIRVRIGSIIPADAKIIESNYLSVDQSMLTGESLPVDKKEGDPVFSSSIVRGGEATCVVTSTGKNTSFGKTVEFIKIAKTKTHLESTIFRILKYLMGLAIVLVIAVFIFSEFVGINLLSIIPFSLLILLTSIPVALPATFTVGMAYGAGRLASKNILITRLESIEEASSMNVVCLDKTGTITKNMLFASEPIPFGGFSVEEVLRYGMLASREEDNDQIDLAVINKAREKDIKIEGYKLVKFMPFDPTTKTSSAIVSINGSEEEAMKGFPSSVMDKCNLDDPSKEKINKEIKDLASTGFRLIAVSRKKGSNWTFLGLIPLRDELREDSKQLISELKSLGVGVKMLTGDNKDTAIAISREAGIGENILSASELQGKDEKTIAELISNADGIAGIYPQDKFTIVKALQDSGFRVGMTGDGVNDAPALKQAEVGIAVSNATDVAKSAADLVLTSNGVELIVSAVKESRSIFERMVTYTVKKASRVIQTSVFLSFAFLILRFLPMKSIQLILALFLSDIGSISLATDNELSANKPDTWDIKAIFSFSMVFGILTIAEAAVIAYLGLSILAVTHQQFETLIFIVFITSMELMTFSIRERRAFWSSFPSIFVITQVVLAILISYLFAYFGILMAPVSLSIILITLGIGMLFLLFGDRLKILLLSRIAEFSSI